MSRERNPATVRKKTYRRRILKYGYGPTIDPFSEQEWLEKIDQLGNRCYYCQIRFLPMSQDHIIPISKGGEHSLANIVPACRACNTAKSNLEISQFRKSEFLRKRRQWVRILEKGTQ